MTDESKPKPAKQQVQDLELNRETVQDLTEQESDQAKGGLARPGTDWHTCNTRCGTCDNGCTGWGGPVGDTNCCVC